MTTVPENTDTNYSATTTRTFSTTHNISSTSVSQTTSIVSTDLEITGSKGIICKTLLFFFFYQKLIFAYPLFF